MSLTDFPLPACTRVVMVASGAQTTEGYHPPDRIEKPSMLYRSDHEINAAATIPIEYFPKRGDEKPRVPFYLHRDIAKMRRRRH